MVKFFGSSGKQYTEWNDINENLVKITVQLYENGAFIVLEQYDYYMFQKYGTVFMNPTVASNMFRGFQVGGYINGIGWTIIDIDLATKQISITLEKEISTIAKIQGDKK